MDEKNGRLYAESGPEREVCAMTMKCPNCGAEFFDGREVCTDCQTPLVKKEEGKNGNAEFGSEGVDVEMLTTVSDHIEAKLLQGILENHGIPSYSVDEESGEYMRVYMGYSIFGEKIYVRASDLLAAQGYLKEWESMNQAVKYGICTDIPGTGQRVWHVPSAPAVYGAAERAGGGCRD